MRGVFDDDEFEEPRLKRDTELTLGVGTLLLVFLGLVLVCGLCFGVGYAVGHRGAQQAPDPAAGQPNASGAQSGSQASASLSKPSAESQPAVAASAQDAPVQGDGSQPAATDLPQTGATVTVPIGATQNQNPAPIPAQPQTRPPEAQVRPALPPPPQASAPQAASVSSTHPALPPSAKLMVQIAAVSHVEDARVLADALSKRGYTVSARREPADNLIHVRVGPFNNREEADRWRLKLLGDGYNALIQP